MTPYEQEQVAAIAAWKSPQPDPGRRALQQLSERASRALGKLLPTDTVPTLMQALNRMAAQLAEDDSILDDPWLRERQIGTLRDLATQPLEVADALANRILLDAERIALGMGAVTGTGGPVAALAGTPLLLGGALRVIHRISQAYGHNSETHQDRMLMLHILALSTAIDPDERRRVLDDYHHLIEASLLRQAISESTLTALQRVLLGSELTSLIPGLGMVLNARFNQLFIREAGIAARRVFQERWLRERGKTGWIAPVQ
ncbi:MAG: hypothetical protein RLZZ226_620 [Pseudomonadota bacterium]